MEDRWFGRLVDTKPEGSFFADYARLLRLLSGLSGRGWIRWAARAARERQEEEHLAALRAHPAVMEFAAFLRSVPEADVPVALGVISDQLFPDREVSWFHSNNLDPLVNPAEAVSSLVQESRSLSQVLEPLMLPLPSPPDAVWHSVPPPVGVPVSQHRAEELIRTCLSESVLNSVQRVSDFVVPSDCLFRVKVELIASGQKIASERFTLHRKSTARRLVEAVRSSFSGLLLDLEGVLFENLHRAVVDLNAVLYEELAEVTRFEFQVDWDLLVRRNGLDALEKAFDLPENLRAIPTSGAEVDGTMILDLIAGNTLLASKRLQIPAKTKIGDILEAILSGHQGFFDNVPSALKLNLDGEGLDLDFPILDIRPFPAKIFFVVSLPELVKSHGMEKIKQFFPTADFSAQTTEEPTQGVLDVRVKADGYLLCQRNMHVPRHGTSDELAQCVLATFAALASVSGFLTTGEGERVPPQVDLSQSFPGVWSFDFHVSFKDMLRLMSVEDVQKAFPDAECLRYIDRYPDVKEIFNAHEKRQSNAVEQPVEEGTKESETASHRVVSDSPVLSEVGQAQLSALGSGAPTSKSAPVSSPHQKVTEEETIRVLQVTLFIEKQRLMLRYEKISRNTTGRDIKARLWAMLPVQYVDLDCELFIGGSHVQLGLDDNLSVNLRPMEVSLDFQILTDLFTKEQIATAKAVCQSALAQFDAAVVAPRSPSQGPSKTQNRKRADRSSSPLHTRPVFGVPGNVPSSGSVPVQRSRQRAMASRGEQLVDDGNEWKPFVLHYAHMPALSAVQNAYLSEIAGKISDFLKKNKVKKMSTVYERTSEDPLLYNSEYLDQSLRSMCAKWKLPLPTLGTGWTVTIQVTPQALPPRLVEIQGEDATVFLQVTDLSTPTSMKKHHGRSRSLHDDEERRSRKRRRDRSHDRRHRGEKEPEESKGGAKPSSEGGKKTSLGEAPAGHEQGPLVATDTIEAGPASSPPLGHVAQIGTTDAISDTLQWSQRPGEIEVTNIAIDEMAPLETSDQESFERLEDVLREVMRKPVPYGSGHGKRLKAFPLVVQTENFQLGRLAGSGDHVAYMVRFGSHDFCYSCFSHFHLDHPPIECPTCGASGVPPVQTPSDIEGTMAPELRVLRKYVPRPQDVLKKVDRCSVEGVIGTQHSRFLRVVFVEGFLGPKGSNECFLLWDVNWPLQDGCEFALFNGMVVGVFLGRPIFGSPLSGSQSALIRRPKPHDDVRVLDLFAGLGGWEFAFDFLSPFQRLNLSRSDIVSVEIDPLCVKVLAHNSQRAVVLPSADLSIIGDGGAVIQGDVCDPDWFGLSLFHPFTDVVWSAPCQPWSLAGNALGFSSDLGLLLAHTVGILHLFRPLRALGENVAGLNLHPQWVRVRQLLSSLPHQMRIQVTDLKFLSPMSRKRLFISHHLHGMPVVAPHVDLKPRHWLDTGCGFLNDQLLKDDLPTESQLMQLSDLDLLPLFERAKAAKENVVNGDPVLLRRVAGPLLPTLVASYRYQCELPPKNLREKGLLTWLVTEARDTHQPRFLDTSEAQRLLGFPFTMLLPEEPGQAMHLLGNSVAPVQGAVMLFRTFGGQDLEALRIAVLHRLYRQPPLSGLVRLYTYGLSRLGVLCSPMPCPRLEARSWHVCFDTIPVACVTELPLAPSMLDSILSIGWKPKVTSCRTFLLEDVLTIFVTLQKVQVTFSSDNGLCASVSPFCVLANFGSFLEHAVLDFPGSLWEPVWMFNCQRLQIQLVRPLSAQRVSRFIFGDEMRVWTYQEGVCFREAIEHTFPFGISHLASVELAGEHCPLDNCPIEGEMYVVTFSQVCLEIAPYGYQWVNPLTTVGQLSDFLSWKRFHGRAVVRIVANGRLIDPLRRICFATQLGPLRAKVFALPGGVALTLSTILAELASELVAHGHPKKDVEKKANEVYDALGHTECKKILESRNVWSVLKAECTRAKIVLVPLSCRGNKEEKDAVFEQDPWANYAESSKKGRAKKTVERPNKAVVKVDMSFFHSSKQPLMQIGLNQLLQGHPGLLVTDLEEFQPHFPTVLKSNTSVGAAGVLLVGASLSDLNVSSSARVTNCVVPGWIGNHSAAVRAVLLCCGDEEVETYHEVSLKVAAPPADHQVVQYHIYRDSCSKWDTLSQQGFEFFLKAIGFGQLMSISQTWSQNFYCKGKKTTAVDADYFHGFLRAEIKVVPKILMLGGYDGFFPSPRTLQRSNDPAYRVLHLRGFSLTDARAVLPSDAFGLTRSKQGYGIRVLSEKYSVTKTKLFPGSVDSSESDEGGAGKFHLLGVPSSVDRSTLKAALRTLKWEVKVSKSAGYRAWTVFSAVDPPTRSFPLHKTTVVILRVDQSQQGPVLATSSKHQPGLKLRLPSSQDVRADIELPSGVTSKYSQLADQSNAKVTELESKVQKLTDTLEQSQKDVSQRFEVVEQEVKSIGQQVAKQSTDLDDKLQSMFDKLFANQKSCMDKIERSNEQAITSLRAEYQTGYTELKEILSNSPKTRKVAGP